MSFAQAYHTSCRDGLAGFSGFQMNAASPRLTREQLSLLSAAHARYDAPRDMPYEPTKEEMKRFPVALRMSLVDGVGPVVSRTEYVGREYRRFDGQPDEGRYGNYFCHLLVGTESGPAFDGSSGIELWDAPHWTTLESPERALPELERLAPGPLDIERVLVEVSRAPSGVMQALIQGAQAALDGGAPLLIIDPDAARAPVWIAFISHCLPPDLAATLAFSTFEGRPRDIFDLHVVVTTPACDPGASGAPSRVDVAAVAAPSAVSLYARVITTIVPDGAQALSRAVRPVTGADARERGASLAIYADRADLIADEDLPATLRCLRELVRVSDIERAAETVAKLATSEAADRAAIGDWIDLHVGARRSTADGARDLAGSTLARIVPVLDALPADAPPVPAGLPTAPSVSGLGAWLRTLEAATDPQTRVGLIHHGVRLGLPGLNVPVDNRVAATIAEQLGTPEMDAALADIGGEPGLSHVIAAAAATLAEQAPGSLRARAGLIQLARYDAARRALRDRADEIGSFDAHMTWQRVRVALEPARRVEAARALMPLVVDDGARSELRELWGPEGPTTQEDLNELLKAYMESGQSPPRTDTERAFRSLMLTPLPTERPPPDHVAWTLGKLPLHERRRPELYAWATCVHAPSPEQTPLKVWSGWAVAAVGADQAAIPDERWRELIAHVAATLTARRRDEDFPQSIGLFVDLGEYEELCTRMGQELRDVLRRAKDPIAYAASEFGLWRRRPDLRLTELMLPVAFERLSQRDVEDVWQVLAERPRGGADEWEAWTRRHPRRTTRDKVGRVFGRKGGRKGGEA